MPFFVTTTSPAPPSAPPVGTYLGLTKTQIIAQTVARCEGRTGQLDLGIELSSALREFCQEYRFYWRNREASITTTPNYSSYDLNAYVSDPGEIIGVFYVKDDGTAKELDPIYKAAEVKELSAAVPGEPSGYTMESYARIRLLPTPNANYVIKVPYRSVPNLAVDDQSDQIPLVPPQHHPAIQKCLEKNVLEFLFGSESPRYTTTSQLYEKYLDKAVKESRDFAYFHRIEEPGKSEPHAIRSTR